MVFPTGDAGRLAECMREVLESPTIASSLGAEARRRAMQAFDSDSMIQSHIALYGEVLLR